MKLRKVGFVALTVVSLAAPAAWGMSSGSIVFDPTNFAKNAITAGSVVKTEITSAATAVQTLKQYVEMIRQAQLAATGNLRALGALAGDPELSRQISDVQSTYTALRTLNGNIDNIAARYDYLTNMSKKYGVTTSQYMQNRATLAQQGVKSAQVEQDQDFAMWQNSIKAYNAVASLQNLGGDTNTYLFQKIDQQGALTNALLSQEAYRRAKEAVMKRDDEANKKALALAAESDYINTARDRAMVAENYSKRAEDKLEEAFNSRPSRK